MILLLIALAGWIAVLHRRIKKLERIAHPPVDLRPAIREILAEELPKTARVRSAASR